MDTRSSSFFASFLIAALVASGAVFAKEEAKTAAPPATQSGITNFLQMIGRSRGCAKLGKPKVLSSEISQDAVVESGLLTSGSVREVWQVRMCGPTVKYLFTLSPDGSGGLKISGFEPLE